MLFPLIMSKHRGESYQQFPPDPASRQFAAHPARPKYLDLSTTGAFPIRQIHEHLKIPSKITV